MNVHEIAEHIVALRGRIGRTVVGVSGFGGAGKSTLARELTKQVVGSVRLRGDDFLDPVRSHVRSPDWNGVERVRIRDEVVEPFLRSEPVNYQPFDWALRQLGPPVALPQADIVVVDAIGLFHPDILTSFSLKIWVDVALQDATLRGMERDERLGRSHQSLWRDIWVPNDRDFAERFSPAAHADILFVPEHVADPQDAPDH